MFSALCSEQSVSCNMNDGSQKLIFNHQTEENYVTYLL